MSSRGWSLLWCVLLGSSLVVLGTAGAVAETGTVNAVDDHALLAEQDPSGEPLVPGVQEGPDSDATVSRIGIETDGTAEWSVTVRMRLDSNELVDEFEAFERGFEANRSTYLGRFQNRMTGVVENAQTVTEREMAATEFEVEIGIEELPRRWGYVTYRFRWHGFAPVTDGAIAVGDVFQGGLFLEADDILIVDGPSGYDVTAVDPVPDTNDSGQLQWNGPESFEDGRPQARFLAPDSSAGGETDDATAEPDTETGENILTNPIAFVGIAAILLGVSAGYIRWRTRQPGETGSEETTTQEFTGEAGPSDGHHPGSEAKAGAGGGAGETEFSETLDLGELATDEDRVLAVLAAEDGRVRQATIADRLDWSASKTSRVTSEMAEDDEIEKLRIGRENVIARKHDHSKTDPSSEGRPM